MSQNGGELYAVLDRKRADFYWFEELVVFHVGLLSTC
jgi:hypothetical protein